MRKPLDSPLIDDTAKYLIFGQHLAVKSKDTPAWWGTILAPGRNAVHGLRSDPGLALLHVVLAEEKLAVQVAGLDGVHINLLAQRIHLLYFELSKLARTPILTISISTKPVRTRVFSNSQPMPPAPTANTLACSTCG